MLTALRDSKGGNPGDVTGLSTELRGDKLRENTMRFVNPVIFRGNDGFIVFSLRDLERRNQGTPDCADVATSIACKKIQCGGVYVVCNFIGFARIFVCPGIGTGQTGDEAE
jgi:hypothetical protein